VLPHSCCARSVWPLDAGHGSGFADKRLQDATLAILLCVWACTEVIVGRVWGGQGGDTRGA